MTNTSVRGLIVTLGLLLASCTPWRALVYNLPDHKDTKIFAHRTAHHSATPFQFAHNQSGINWGQALKVRHRQFLFPLDSTVLYNKCLAMLVIRHDTILYQYYRKGYSDTSRFNSFSVAKGFVNLMAAMAYQEGKLPSLEAPITQFLPEYAGQPGYSAIKIHHLMDQTSGLEARWDFSNLNGHLTRSYYGRDLRGLVKDVKAIHPPGTVFAYNNINTLLVGLMLERLYQKPLAQLLEEKIWKPLGMEADAFWTLDKEGGVEKAFCCVHAIARDYARIARLMHERGKWNGQQLLPDQLFRQLETASTEHGRSWDYQWHWNIINQKSGLYMLRGLYAQTLCFHPASGTTIVILNGPVVKENPPYWADMCNQLVHQLSR